MVLQYQWWILLQNCWLFWSNYHLGRGCWSQITVWTFQKSPSCPFVVNSLPQPLFSGSPFTVLLTFGIGLAFPECLTNWIIYTFSIIHSRFIHVVAYISIFRCITVMHSPFGHLGCLQILAFVNKAPKNSHLQVVFVVDWDFLLSKYLGVWFLGHLIPVGL